MQQKHEPDNQEGVVQAPCQHRMRTLVNLSFFDCLRFYIREMLIEMCFIEMCPGAMWTSLILVKTQLHPNQGLDGSGLVRPAIPIGKRQVTTACLKWKKRFLAGGFPIFLGR